MDKPIPPKGRIRKEGDVPKKPYKYEKLDRYAGYGILGISGSFILAIIYWMVTTWPI